MIRFFLTVLLSTSTLVAWEQTTTNHKIFQASGKTGFYYLLLGEKEGKAYQMGNYLDKAGTGYSIRARDILIRKDDSSYQGTFTRVADSSLLVHAKNGEKVVLRMKPVKSELIANTNINNGYFLGNYFKMSEELNNQFPLNNHSFRSGFRAWDTLSNKDINPQLFTSFADTRISEIKNRVSRTQKEFVATTDYLIASIKTIEYATLKDSLSRLPAQYRYLSWYYGTVVNEIAKQRPDYFFKLAEEFPGNRALIFSAVEPDKKVTARLKAVAGFDEMKSAFFKGRK